MKRLQERLKAAKAEHTIRLRQFNAAERALHKVLVEINTLEKRLELWKAKQDASMAKT